MNRQPRDFDVVELHPDKVVALNDVVETIAATLADTLPRDELIFARVENQIKHCVSRYVALQLEHSEIAIQGEDATCTHIFRRRCECRLGKHRGVQGERKSDEQDEALSRCHKCTLRERYIKRFPAG